MLDNTTINLSLPRKSLKERLIKMNKKIKLKNSGNVFHLVITDKTHKKDNVVTILRNVQKHLKSKTLKSN